MNPGLNAFGIARYTAIDSDVRAVGKIVVCVEAAAGGQHHQDEQMAQRRSERAMAEHRFAQHR